MSACWTTACTFHDSPARPLSVRSTLVGYGRPSSYALTGERVNVRCATCSGVNGGLPAPASCPPYAVTVTFTLADVYARTFARELPAWQVIVVVPPWVIVTGPPDALGNSFDTSPIRAHRSPGSWRAGTR